MPKQRACVVGREPIAMNVSDKNLSPELQRRVDGVLAKIADATTLEKRAEVEAEANALTGEIGALTLIKIAQTRPQQMFLKGT
jgi:hypothetical protein